MKLSKLNSYVVKAYEKGYRIVSGDVMSPYRLKPLCVNIRIFGGVPYARFNISTKGSGAARRTHQVLVHKLVAYQKYGLKSFEPDTHIRHIDGNSLNNLESNIALGTASDNMMDKSAEEREAQSVRAATKLRKFTDTEMDEIRSTHVNYKDTMARYGITSKGTLHYILNADYKTKV
jgi:hypothetical protein